MSATLTIALGNYPAKLALALHSLEMGPVNLFDSTTTLYRSAGFWDQNITESIEILLEDLALNRGTGFQLNSSWKPVLTPLNNEVLID